MSSSASLENSPSNSNFLKTNTLPFARMQLVRNSRKNVIRYLIRIAPYRPFAVNNYAVEHVFVGYVGQAFVIKIKILRHGDDALDPEGVNFWLHVTLDFLCTGVFLIYMKGSRTLLRETRRCG